MNTEIKIDLSLPVPDSIIERYEETQIKSMLRSLPSFRMVDPYTIPYILTKNLGLTFDQIKELIGLSNDPRNNYGRVACYGAGLSFEQRVELIMMGKSKVNWARNTAMSANGLTLAQREQLHDLKHSIAWEKEQRRIAKKAAKQAVKWERKRAIQEKEEAEYEASKNLSVVS